VATDTRSALISLLAAAAAAVAAAAVNFTPNSSAVPGLTSVELVQQVGPQIASHSLIRMMPFVRSVWHRCAHCARRLALARPFRCFALGTRTHPGCVVQRACALACGARRKACPCSQCLIIGSRMKGAYLYARCHLLLLGLLVCCSFFLGSQVSMPVALAGMRPLGGNSALAGGAQASAAAWLFERTLS
jgi:hypothetical protein